MSIVLSDNNCSLVEYAIETQEYRGQAVVPDEGAEPLRLILSEDALLPGGVSECQYEENRSYILNNRRHFVDSLRH
jgi:hypothetical protein